MTSLNTPIVKNSIYRQATPPVERRLSESIIVRQLAHALCQRISRKSIRALQGMTDALLSGEGSGLKSTWDEICIQIQYEESYAWNAYHATVHALISAEVDGLQDYEQEAIWLQTPQGAEWECKNTDEREPYPVVNNDVVNYLLQEYIVIPTKVTGLTIEFTILFDTVFKALP